MDNQNYFANPETTAYYSEINKRERYEKEKQRKLSNMSVRQTDPSYRVTPDEIVDISEPE